MKTPTDEERRQLIAERASAVLVRNKAMHNAMLKKQMTVLGLSQSTFEVTNKDGSFLKSGTTSPSIAASGTAVFPYLHEILHPIFKMCSESGAEWCPRITSQPFIKSLLELDLSDKGLDASQVSQVKALLKACRYPSYGDLATDVWQLLTKGVGPDICHHLVNGDFDKIAISRPIDRVYRALLSALTGENFLERFDNDRAYCFEKKSFLMQLPEVISELTRSASLSTGWRGLTTTVTLQSFAYQLYPSRLGQEWLPNALANQLSPFAPCSSPSCELASRYCASLVHELTEGLALSIAAVFNRKHSSVFSEGDQISVVINFQHSAEGTSHCKARYEKKSDSVQFRCSASGS